MKCKEKGCSGIILMVIEKKIRKFKCNKCDEEYFVYRKKRKNVRPEV